MSILKKLNIVPEDKNVGADPFVATKRRLVKNLQTQLKCAEAMVVGEIYTIPSTKLVQSEGGTKSQVIINHAPRHWYWRDADGKVRFSVRVFNKRLELEKGKTDILVGDDKELPSVIKSAIEAVNGGELDSVIKLQIEARKRTKNER